MDREMPSTRDMDRFDYANLMTLTTESSLWENIVEADGEGLLDICEYLYHHLTGRDLGSDFPLSCIVILETAVDGEIMGKYENFVHFFFCVVQAEFGSWTVS